MELFPWWFSWNSKNNRESNQKTWLLFIKNVIWDDKQMSTIAIDVFFCVITLFFRIQFFFVNSVNKSLHLFSYWSLVVVFCAVFLFVSGAIQMKSIVLFIAKDCKDTIEMITMHWHIDYFIESMDVCTFFTLLNWQ